MYISLCAQIVLSYVCTCFGIIMSQEKLDYFLITEISSASPLISLTID